MRPATFRSDDLPKVKEFLGLHRPVRLTVAAGMLCCLGLVAFAETQAATAEAETTAAQIVQQAEEERAASRSAERASRAQSEARVIVPDEPAQPVAVRPPGQLESGPVAGLSEVQMNNAKAIVWTGVDMGMPRRALIIAVATAMQESTLLNRASEVLPESKRYPHQGTGWDHDSVGLFQQRTSTGWGPVSKLMDPAYASQKFYRALMRVPGWQNMRVTEAAQAVQVSAFPEHYAKHERLATQVVDALSDVD